MSMLRSVILTASVAVMPLAIQARNAVPPQPERTVMWYVGHPAELRAVMAACANNPGAAKHNPDCENVVQAQLVLAANRASSVTDLTPPTSPHYWFVHPEQLGPELFYCSHTQDAEVRHQIFCDSAEAAEKMR
jgi:hypothetical protein